MIKILPFLLIGKALKPLAKIKKAGYKAMGNAFSQMKSSVDPMKSFGKIMEVLSVVMLPLTYIFTLLAAVILNKLMPYIEWLIENIDKLGISSETTAENMWYMGGALDHLLYLIPVLTGWFIALYNAMHIWFLEADWGLTRFFAAWDKGIDDLYDKIVGFFEGLGGGGGGGGDDGDGWELPEWPELPPGYPPIIGSSTSSNNITIDLSNSVIESKDALVRDIVEQVIIRLG